MRVGYVCANKEIVQKIVVCKQVSDVHTNIWSQIICHEFITKYNMSAHINKLKDIYRHKCNLMLSGIKEHFSDKVTYTTPQGGLFIWCTIPEKYDVGEFCTIAVQNKIATVPGNAFLPSENMTTHSFRINYSTPTDEQIVNGIKMLGDLTKNMFK